jgi:hypothetical protein
MNTILKLAIMSVICLGSIGCTLTGARGAHRRTSSTPVETGSTVACYDATLQAVVAANLPFIVGVSEFTIPSGASDAYPVNWGNCRYIPRSTSGSPRIIRPRDLVITRARFDSWDEIARVRNNVVILETGEDPTIARISCVLSGIYRDQTTEATLSRLLNPYGGFLSGSGLTMPSSLPESCRPQYAQILQEVLQSPEVAAYLRPASADAEPSVATRNRIERDSEPAPVAAEPANPRAAGV